MPRELNINELLGDRPGQLALQRAASRLKASYDAARTTNEFQNYWANADAYDADSANSKEVRQKLVSRSRYEVANNAYSDGIAQTITNDLIGVGPSLRMQSGSEGFNRLVESTWNRWQAAAGFRRKLWCMGHAKHQDGEALGVMRINKRLKHGVKLDVVLYETEQFQTPYMRHGEPGHIDGIRFDEFGNPTYYELLKEHPGSAANYSLMAEPEQIAADKVLHWFRLRRPGQHRGVPEMTSSLNAGAASRRWREATLSAAERAALLTLMMKTQMAPDETTSIAPFSDMDIAKGLMTFLPGGWEPTQLSSEFPTASHESFLKSLINEQGRSVNMPRNKAAADSSDYNYASGRLDHGTYYDSLDVQRQDCNELVLDPLFATWFDLAVVRFNWIGGVPESISDAAKSHTWDWPKHRVADVEAEANANQTKLQSGQAFLHRIYADAGWDLEDELDQAATTYGVSTEVLRQRLLDTLLPEPNVGGAPEAKPTQATTDKAVANFFRRNGVPKTNGAHHG